MSDVRERERRRWYLERFLERTGSGTVADEDAPAGAAGELRIETDGGTVSVRIVELLGPGRDPGVRESVRAFRSAVVEAAEEAWSKGGDRPDVEVWVEFSAHEQTTAARDRDELARRLCEVVESELPGAGGFARIVAGRGRDDASFPLVAPAVTVARLPTYTGTTWHGVEAAGPKAVDADGVRAAVARASAGDRRASEDAERRWLVLVLESFRHPSVGGVPEDVTSEGFESDFDGLWIYDPVSGEARELRGR